MAEKRYCGKVWPNTLTGQDHRCDPAVSGQCRDCLDKHRQACLHDAAPKLLDALRCLLHQYGHEHGDVFTPSGGWQETDPNWAAARAAVKQAEGRD